MTTIEYKLKKYIFNLIYIKNFTTRLSNISFYYIIIILNYDFNLVFIVLIRDNNYIYSN